MRNDRPDILLTVASPRVLASRDDVKIVPTTDDVSLREGIVPTGAWIILVPRPPPYISFARRTISSIASWEMPPGFSIRSLSSASCAFCLRVVGMAGGRVPLP